MPAPTVEQVRELLARIPYPGFSRDIVSFGVVDDVTVEQGRVTVQLIVASQDPKVGEHLQQEVSRALSELQGVEGVDVQVRAKRASQRLPTAGEEEQKPPKPAGPEAKSIIGIASGKGGVGKSTVAVNLAVSLARAGRRVGFLDADVHGPSAPLMFGLEGRRPETADEQGRPFPLEAYGVHVMSMGFFVERGNAVIWRGPIVGNFIKQLLSDIAWGSLDYLIIDLPPGTGDAQLTLSQTIQMTGSIVVTTPNDLALIDAMKAIAMFQKVEVPVFGIVENMSHFVCPHCGEETRIYGSSEKVEAAARENEVPILGFVPIDPDVVRESDAGRPVVIERPDSPAAQAYRGLAEGVMSREEASGQASSGEGGGVASFFKKFGKD
jgi:ATP-binding protein involved in chromosome partitioning